MKFQLVNSCPFLLKVENSETVVDSILEVWKNLTRRAYSYYRMAAMSYLQYLHLNGKVRKVTFSESILELSANKFFNFFYVCLGF